MPKVSVIIPVYGVENYIEKCVRTLFEQTLDDIEYLFIDDCTPDKSIEILKCVLKEYPSRQAQVIIHRMEQNSGQAKVREWGMTHAIGEYIIHCDSDDWVDTEMYGKLYKYAIETKSDMVFCDYYKERKDSSIRYSRNITDTEKTSVIKRLLTQTSLNPVWSVLVHRSLVCEISYPQCAQGEDRIINIQECWYSSKIAYLEQPFYHYRILATSITHSSSNESLLKRYKQEMVNARTLITFLEEQNILKSLHSELQAYLFNLLKYLHHNLGNKEVRDLWSNHFPNLMRGIYRNSYISLKYKLFYYYTLIRY